MTPGARTLLILHAEDNPDHAELVLRCLRKYADALTVVRVEDGEAVLDYVCGRPPHAGAARPDLILLDLRLPKADGLEVLRELKSHPASACIPVVVLTTSVRASDIQEAYRLHANSYLAKPIDLRALDELLRDFAQYWVVRNQSAPAPGLA
jgi:CheY-like chemotaxis protein